MASSLSGMKVAILVTNGEVRVKDRKITSCSSLRNRPPNAGAHRVDQEVVVEARKTYWAGTLSRLYLRNEFTRQLYRNKTATL